MGPSNSYLESPAYDAPIEWALPLSSEGMFAIAGNGGKETSPPMLVRHWLDHYLISVGELQI